MHYVSEKMLEAVSALCSSGKWSRRLGNAGLALVFLNADDLDGELGEDLRFVLGWTAGSIVGGNVVKLPRGLARRPGLLRPLYQLRHRFALLIRRQVGISERHRERSVPKEFAAGVEWHAGLYQARDEMVAEIMPAEFGDLRPLQERGPCRLEACIDRDHAGTFRRLFLPALLNAQPRKKLQTVRHSGDEGAGRSILPRVIGERFTVRSDSYSVGVDLSECMC